MVVETSLERVFCRIERHWFGPADARVYGLLRIALSLAAIVNLLAIWPERYQLFAEDGMISRAAVAALSPAHAPLSIFAHVRSHLGIDAVLVVSLLLLCALALGLFVRFAAIGAYFWHLSYTGWAFFDLGGWDFVLRAGFFVLAVAPSGDPYCLSYRWSQRRPPNELPRYALVMMRYQVIVVYLSTAWLKSGNEFWRRGELLEYFSLSVFSNDQSTAVLAWPASMAFLTYLALAIEFAVGFLLLSKRWRWLGFLAGVGLHLGIAFASNLGVFSLVMLATYPAFLDGDDIDRVTERVRYLYEFARQRWITTDS